MSGIVYLDDLDAETQYGFRASRIPGFRDAPVHSYDVTRIPGGRNLIGKPAIIEPRILEITGRVGEAGETWAQRSARVRAMDAAIGRGEIPIRFGDATLEVFGRRLGRTVVPPAPYADAWVGVPWDVTLRFLCVDPHYYATTATTISSISTTPKTIPAGTAPIGGILTITGGTNPVVTIRDSAGATIATYTFTANNTGKTIVIDFGLRRITTTIDGVTWPLELWTGSDPPNTEWWVPFDPIHWDVGASDWMDIAVSSGSGQFVYYPAYDS